MNPVVLLACLGGPLLLIWLLASVPAHRKQRQASLEERFGREVSRREVKRWWDDYKAGKPRKIQ